MMVDGGGIGGAIWYIVTKVLGGSHGTKWWWYNLVIVVHRGNGSGSV